MPPAACSAGTTRGVSSSGSPEPALTSVTLPAPAAVAWSLVALRIASKSDDAGSRSGLRTAKAAKSRQNRRRPDGESPEDCTALRQRRGGAAPPGKPPRNHAPRPGGGARPETRAPPPGRKPDGGRGGVAVGDGTEGKIAIGGPIDHIDWNAGRARGAGEALGLRLIVEAADGEGSAGKVLDPPRPLLQHDRRARGLRRDGAQLLAWPLGKDRDIGAGRRPQPRFPAPRCAVAGDDGALAVERQENRQPRQRSHARRMRWHGITSVLDRGHQYTSC